MCRSSSTTDWSGSARARTCFGHEVGTWTTSGVRRAGDPSFVARSDTTNAGAIDGQAAATAALPTGAARAGACDGDRSAVDADRLAVDDLIEVLRQPVSDLAVATPLGHALRNACHEHVA